MVPTLQHFETFLKVAEEQSFTQAAKKLGVSKSAVSQTINLLENSLKLPLFIRSTRVGKLTDEGLLLYQQCQHLQTELDTTRGLLGSFKTSPEGTLKISCGAYFAERYLLDLIARYQHIFPKVNLELLIEERMPDMQRENIDIVFAVNWPAPDEIVAREIGQTRYVFCASPAYLDKYGEPKKLQELATHHYIPHLGRIAENVIPSLKKRVQVSLNTPIKINNVLLMKQCALKGYGITSLHDYMVADALKAGTLIEVLKGCQQPKVPIYIYYQKHRFVQPKIRQMVNLILNHDFNLG